MINIHLLVDEGYIEELMLNLPKDKVKVVEENFEENKILLAEAFNEYKSNLDSTLPYNESIQNINLWLQEKGKQWK